MLSTNSQARFFETIRVLKRPLTDQLMMGLPAMELIDRLPVHVQLQKLLQKDIYNISLGEFNPVHY